MSELGSDLRSAAALETPRGRASVLDANVRLLGECGAALGAVSDAIYACTTTFAPSGSIGEHLRHCLDFYAVLLRDLPSGRIDYVQRARNRRVEADRAFALKRAAEIAREIARIPADQLKQPLLVRSEDDGCGPESPEAWSRSTLQRELQFLISHSVHHFALIAVVLRTLGHEPPATFGVASSTLRHRQSAPH